MTLVTIKHQLGGGRPEQPLGPTPASPGRSGAPPSGGSWPWRSGLGYAKLKQSSEPTQAVAAKPKKRKLSAAGRRAIIAATKKRWAAVKAAKQSEKPAAVKKAVGKKA